MVIWLVGLSGAGKTTLGRAMWQKWRTTASNVAFIDGDEIRAIFNQDREAADYSLEGRRSNAERIVAMCEWLDRQGINVVCCILSVFQDMRAENRTRFSRYFEIFVDASLSALEARDGKSLYSGARSGKTTNVVGVDLPFERPTTSDLTIDTSGPMPDIDALATQVLAEALYPFSRGKRLEQRNTYMYSAYLGHSFLNAYVLTRTKALASLPPPAQDPVATSIHPSEQQLQTIFDALAQGKLDADLDTLLCRLLQRFEITKRVHGAYNSSNFRAVDATDYKVLGRYVRLAEVLERSYTVQPRLPELSALLKCLDTLVACCAELSTAEGARVAWLIEREQLHVRALAERHEVPL